MPPSDISFEDMTTVTRTLLTDTRTPPAHPPARSSVASSCPHLRQSLFDPLSVAERDLAATGDVLNSAKALAWRGRVLACDGRLVEARPTFAGALDTFRAQGSRSWEACVLSWLADIDAACGRPGTPSRSCGTAPPCTGTTAP
ncbi:hypothetical protein [Kitasatospora sp. NPDC096140]|uniref:hypothetical protein n=1 Tax=Kitasatospora sp. NPDC096140 TaxID=3155425 RepID=UPI00332B0EB9